MSKGATLNAVFRSHHTGRLLHQLGVFLPRLLNGQNLALESRAIEQLCWRELGYLQKPVFYGDLPSFLVVDADGIPADLLYPTAPAELASRMAALEQAPSPEGSHVGANLKTLARLLNLTPFESQWLLWSYCTRRFGRAILPAIPMSDDRQGCEVLALLANMPRDVVQDAVISRRLHTWGFLAAISTDSEMPSLLSGWLSATDQFADWIEQPYASDSELLTALCQAQVSLTASR